MSPLSGLTDPKGDVYVLNRYVRGRDVKRVPTSNAERPDTDFFYETGVYDAHPERKTAYEKRRAAETRKVARVQDWAVAALDALDAGQALPEYPDRPVLGEILLVLYDVGAYGVTRPEMCRMLHRDGGKVSGAMSDLHAARIIYPLAGVRR